MFKKFIETGKIVGTHGVRGELRIQPWADALDFLLDFKIFYLDAEGKTHLCVSSARIHGNLVLVKVTGVDSMESAEALRNKVIYIDRRDFSITDGSYLIQDLIGCKVYHTDRNYEKSKPEWGINYSKKNRDLLEQYRIEKFFNKTI